MDGMIICEISKIFEKDNSDLKISHAYIHGSIDTNIESCVY